MWKQVVSNSIIDSDEWLRKIVEIGSPPPQKKIFVIQSMLLLHWMPDVGVDTLVVADSSVGSCVAGIRHLLRVSAGRDLLACIHISARLLVLASFVANTLFLGGIMKVLSLLTCRDQWFHPAQLQSIPAMWLAFISAAGVQQPPGSQMPSIRSLHAWRSFADCFKDKREFWCRQSKATLIVMPFG